jgi:hypothetical protein
MKTLGQIPALILKGGGKDTSADTRAGPGSEETWRTARSMQAPWTFSLDPDATHADEEFFRKANTVTVPWIAAVMRQRVGPDGKLRPVSESSGLLGNNETGEFAPYATYTGPKAEASWLPDEATARGWQTAMGK